MKPTNTEYTADGQFYKTGAHGYLYVWRFIEWVRSPINLEDIKAAIHREANREEKKRIADEKEAARKRWLRKNEKL